MHNCYAQHTLTYLHRKRAISFRKEYIIPYAMTTLARFSAKMAVSESEPKFVLCRTGE